MSARVIIVPLDGSVQAVAALYVARAIARIHAAELRVIAPRQSELTLDRGARWLGVDPSELRGVHLEQIHGEALGEEIVRSMHRLNAMMIAMSIHLGRAGAPGEPATIVQEVLERARCPLVLVPPGPDARAWAPRRILLPHDGAPSTSAAIGPAADLASRARARLAVLFVASPTPKVEEPGSLVWPRYVDQAQHEWPAWASEFLERICCALPLGPDQLDLSLVTGEPGPEIVRFAEGHDSDLIVMAWRGNLHVGHAATLRVVLGRAPCPVLVLRRLEVG